MDPVSLVLLIVLFEAATGGYLSATVGGAASAAWSATWREVAGSAKSSYANRATRLGQSKTGRWRLAAEKRVWNGGQRVQAGVAGLARGGGRAVAAGVKAAPGGAQKWRGSRRWTFGDVAGGLRRGVNVGRGKQSDGGEVTDGAEYRDCRHCRGKGCNFDDLLPGQAYRACDRCGHAMTEKGVAGWGLRCPNCGIDSSADEHGNPMPNPMDTPLGPPPNWALIDRIVAKIPATDAGEKEEQVSTDLSGCAEDRGVKPYVEGWDGEVGGTERLVAEISAIRDRIAAAVEANKRHDPDGAEDVAGAWTAFVEAGVRAGEMTDSHTDGLHQKWDTTIEHLNSTGAESAQELVGAH